MAAQTLSPPKNIWSALRAAKEKAALSGDNFQFSTILAGAEGFEPPNARTKTWCLTTWRRPNISLAKQNSRSTFLFYQISAKSERRAKTFVFVKFAKKS